MLMLLLLPILSAASPRGWHQDGMLPWSQVSNFSEWNHAVWYEDGANLIGLVDQFVRGPDRMFLSVSYQDTPNSTVKDSVAFVYTYFAVDGDACFTADTTWNSIPHQNDPPLPPQFVILCSIGTLEQASAGWDYSGYDDFSADSQVQFDLNPRLCPGFTGRFRLSLEYGINPARRSYPFASGSSFVIANAKIVLGKCVDKQHELVVLLATMGAFLSIFFALCIALYRLQKKHPGGKPFVALAAWWHLYNLASHALFAWSMYNRAFSVPYVMSVFFLAVPCIVQMAATCVGMATELRRAEFSVWYYRHRIVCNTLGTLMPVLGVHMLALMHSKLAGFSGFSAPFSSNAIARIKFFLLLASFMQDVPQFILQVVMYTAADPNPIIIVSLITSLCTVVYRVSIWARHTRLNWGVAKSGIVSSQSVGATSGEWIELWDSETGKWYYENQRTHVTTWDKPTEFVTPTLELSKPSQSFLQGIISRKRILFSALAAIIFFGLGMATRFHVTPQGDTLST